MANNRLGLRCTACKKIVTLARLSAGDAAWMPARNGEHDFEAFLREHSNCFLGEGAGLHVDLVSENDHLLVIAKTVDPGLLAAARSALEEMCNTTAPRNSFTDAVDALDAAITKASPIET